MPELPSHFVARPEAFNALKRSLSGTAGKLGITSMDQLRALDREWRAWVADLCAKHQDSDWLPTRHTLFKLMGVK